MGDNKKSKSSIVLKAKRSYKDYQERLAQQRAENEKRIAKEKADEEKREYAITTGDIEPLETDYNLEKGENAYAVFHARKMGRVEKAVHVTSRQGVASRAGCGCCLFGPLGALLGGATAPSKTNQITHESLTTLDQGTMVFTNKRFLFIGDNSITSLFYDKMMSINFHSHSAETDLEVRYPEMLKGEYYALTGQDFKIAELWCQGIRKIKTHKERGKNG